MAYYYHGTHAQCTPRCVAPYKYVNLENDQILPELCMCDYSPKSASWKERDETKEYTTFIELACEDELRRQNCEVVWCFKVFGDCKISANLICEYLERGGYTPHTQVDGVYYYKPFGDVCHEMIATFRCFCRHVLDSALTHDIDVLYTAMVCVPYVPERGL